MTPKASEFSVAALFIISLAAPLPCAAQTSSIAVSGTLTNEGVLCRALRADDGTLYTFRRNRLTDDLKAGDRIRLEGTVAEVSICQQGVTIVVTKAEHTK